MWSLLLMLVPPALLPSCRQVCDWYHVPGQILVKQYLSPASGGDGALLPCAAGACRGMAILLPLLLCPRHEPRPISRPAGPTPRSAPVSPCPSPVPPAEPVPISALINGVGQLNCSAPGARCRYPVLPAARGGTCELPLTDIRIINTAGFAEFQVR